MYRLAVLLALLVALAAAGCGGSGDDSDSAPSAVADAPESAPGGSAAAEEAKQKNQDDATEQSSEGEDGDDEAKTEEEEHEEVFAKLPLERKTALIETVIRAALLRFGLQLVDVQVGKGAHSATATVARKGVCNFVASQEPNLMVFIQEGAPGLKSVRFEVAGTGQELGYYVLSCKAPEIPSGAGRLVFDHSGVGGPYTKRFKIKSKHWAFEWVNEAASLAVVVSAVGGESKGEWFKPVGSQKRESDRYDYTGRGTFEIKAYGSGGWRLRVKEIR